MPYVYSTATGGIDYVQYKPSSIHAASHQVLRKVSIAGGANLAPVQGRLVTPKGVATHVSDEELKFLMNDETFKRHMAAGFMYVDEKKMDADKVVRDKGMNPQDGSAPITPKSKEVLGTAVPVVPEPPSNRKA